MLAVTSAHSLERMPSPRVVTRPNFVAVGTIVWLSSELMFFAALFAMYYTIRAVQVGRGPWPPPGVVLDLKTAAPFTVILVLSSVTCQLGVFAAEKGDVFGLRRWFIYTYTMGAVFICGEAYEFFVHNDFSWSSHAYGTIYYLMTGFHALHVLGGLLAFQLMLGRTTFGRWTPAEATSAIVVSYYWHFVDIVWVAVFATIYLIR